MKKLLIAAALLGILASSPVFATEEAVTAPAEQPRYLPREMITVETQSGQDYIFDVEIAKEPPDLAHGLMWRTQLSSDSGMLFLFDEDTDRSFWMKNTLIALDMVFIAQDGTINHIHHNAKPQDETRIATDQPAIAVLEINGGLAGSLDIKEGDRIIHPAFRNVVAPQ